MANFSKNNFSGWLDDFPWPAAEGNKYTRGHVLIRGGATLTGAARLAARAAQRIGAGLVTIAAPKSAVDFYSSALESVMVLRADSVGEWNKLLADERKNALLLGPGMGTGEATKKLVLSALKTAKPCVLDADALTSFAKDGDVLFDALHEKCVLTPHEGEFVRLFGEPEKGEDKIFRAKKAAAMSGCSVLLKGRNTVIANEKGMVMVNEDAPPNLATAGSGDVLAGMIAGLIAAGMPVFKASAAAAAIHTEIARCFGYGLIAEDLIDSIPNALKSLSEIAGKAIV